MKRPAAFLCAVLLAAVLLAVPVQASMTTETAETAEPVETPPASQPEAVTVPPGLTEADVYTGPVDSFTGTPLGAAQGELGGEKTPINDATGYNQERHLLFTRRSSQEILCSVADGMTTTDPVTLLVPDGLSCTLYRNGNEVQMDLTDITEPGFYVLVEQNYDQTELMRFTIVPPVTGQLSGFSVPEGFRITSARCNGNGVEHSDTYVSLAQEGKYVVEYTCPATETRYNFTVEVDHTPPVLALPGVDEKSQARGPVDISDLEEGARIGIWLNGTEIEPSPVLTQRGSYHLILEDAAGNRAEYQFIIRYYFNASGVIILVVVLAVGLGTGLYVLLTRKHLRVR